MKLMLYVSDIIEWGTPDDSYDFPIKAKDLNDDKVISFINDEISDYGLVVEKIVKKEDVAYSTSRFFDGQDAQDEGHTCYIDFFSMKDYKKGYGKCTNYTVLLKKIEGYDD